MTHTIYHCLITLMYQKLKIAWYLLDKVQNEWERRAIHSRELVNRQANMKTGLT